jgi:hypothetical protein
MAPAPRPRLRPGEELLTVLLATWLIVGLFLDGWAHDNVPELESFLTPWHAVFYSGFVATAGWMAWLVGRNLRRGSQGLAAVPVGCGLGLAGVGVFAVGGVGDAIWHSSSASKPTWPRCSAPPTCCCSPASCSS